MNKLYLKDLIFQALIGAIYVVLVLVLIPISFGQVQFRIAEALLVLVFFSKKHMIGLLIGTFIANLFSPESFGFYDAMFGTLTSAIAIYLMLLFKNHKFIAMLFPVLLNAFYVATLLNVMILVPFWLSVFTVGLGEAVVVYLVGLPLYHMLNKNQGFVEIIS